MHRFIKISATGEQLDDDAQEWVAVLDTKQGLMFTVHESAEMEQPRAVEYVKTLEVGGCKSDWYWTDTRFAGSPGDCAWGVDFHGGGANWDGQGDCGFVRAVRPGQ